MENELSQMIGIRTAVTGSHSAGIAVACNGPGPVSADMLCHDIMPFGLGADIYKSWEILAVVFRCFFHIDRIGVMKQEVSVE